MKKVFVVLDVETVTSARLVFDIAWHVCDSKGNILESYNALVKEVVDTPFIFELLRKDDFMKDKCQMYIDALVMNSIDVKCLYDISVDFYGIAKRYNAQVIMCAYNAKFDYEVLNNNLHIYEGDDIYFFDNVDNIIDIMTMALATICNTNKYVRWCNLNGFITPKGNIKTSAETVYAYISQNCNFVEAHHALEDCDIEKEILFKARKYRKKHHTKFAMPVFRCPEWKQVQARNK